MIKRRPPKEQFTPAALVAFKRMRELENECTCALSADPSSIAALLAMNGGLSTR